ncbi:hypothetical protein TRIUR3_08469 [Triticum urartu]|uniref:Trichome birefringence-like C-terminal domain-containing protein n=1 Tax=Triticum urartu TaxID=4572 RepID=M7Y5U9_TRIUA|nr:hypothetical protein TRIUR3_08469 [Triticum urartu]
MNKINAGSSGSKECFPDVIAVELGFKTVHPSTLNDLPMGNYFTVGDCFNVTTNIKEAFQQSPQMVKDWALTNPQLAKTSYLFFRSYSPSHYDNGTWVTGGSYADKRDPLMMITSDSDQREHLWINTMILSVVRSMRRRHGMNKEAFS